MQVLRISTAATVIVGPVLDSGGLAVTNAVIGDFRVSKNGATTTLGAPSTVTHSHNGHYAIALATSISDSEGHLEITTGNSSHAMPSGRFQVVSADVFELLFRAGANGQVTVISNLDKTGYSAVNSQQIVISPAAILHNEHFKTTPYNPNPLNVPWKAQKTFSISVYTLSESGEKVPVDMTGKTLRIVFENANGTDLAVLENAAITKTNNTFTFTNPTAAATPANSARKLTGKWSCRETSTDFAWAYGAWEVIDVAFKDA